MLYHTIRNPQSIPSVNETTTFYNLDDIIGPYDSIPQRKVIKINEKIPVKQVVLFNSLSFARSDVVRLLISAPFVQVSIS